MKKIYFLLVFQICFISHSQDLEYGNSIESINICNAIQGKNFASERAADSALDDILNVIGASKRFVLQECSNINNAIALTLNGVRYIMYDPEFMTSLSYGNNWTSKFILAHEVGHHINGHTVDVLAANISNKVSLSTSRIQELEADEFAGFVLGRLGATLSDALSGVQSLSDEDDSYSTHPRRSRRIAAIKKGFNESGGYVNPSNVSVKKGKTVDSPYSNSRFSGVDYVTMNYKEGVYTGYVGIESNKPFGYGEYRTSDGYIYEGEWSAGSTNGYGKQIYKSGNVYEGYFVSGGRSGQGVFTFASGEKYIGTFAEGVFVKGKKIFEDHTDEGLWSKSRNLIRLTRTYKDGSKEPDEWGFLDGSNGNGMATFTYGTGTKITANFKDAAIPIERGLLAGEYGTFPRRDYTGKHYGHRKATIHPTFVFDFIPDQLQRELGITNATTFDFTFLYDSTGALKFLEKHTSKKIYNENLSSYKQFYGRGTLKSNDWSSAQYLQEKYSGYSYVGETLGYGEMTWPDGAIYKGYFLSGGLKRAGYGEFYYGPESEEESYKGMWWFNKRNGYGIMKYKSGKTDKGVFKNNVFLKSEDFDFERMQKTFKVWY